MDTTTGENDCPLDIYYGLTLLFEYAWNRLFGHWFMIDVYFDGSRVCLFSLSLVKLFIIVFPDLKFLKRHLILFMRDMKKNFGLNAYSLMYNWRKEQFLFVTATSILWTYLFVVIKKHLKMF